MGVSTGTPDNCTRCWAHKGASNPNTTSLYNKYSMVMANLKGVYGVRITVYAWTQEYTVDCSVRIPHLRRGSLAPNNNRGVS